MDVLIYCSNSVIAINVLMFGNLLYKIFMEKRIVCHISYHGPFDDRIYWKQLLALKQSGYEACHIAVADRDDDYYTKEEIRVITIKNLKLSRNVYLNKVMQLFSKKSITVKILAHAANIKADIYQYH